MTDAKKELKECLAELEQLARQRLNEHSEQHMLKQYEMVATNAAGTREAVSRSDWQHFGKGMGLGFTRGLGDLPISMTDAKIMRLARKIDQLHKTGESRGH